PAARGDGGRLAASPAVTLSAPTALHHEHKDTRFTKSSTKMSATGWRTARSAVRGEGIPSETRADRIHPAFVSKGILSPRIAGLRPAIRQPFHGGRPPWCSPL